MNNREMEARFTAIILMSGSGSRFGSSLPKQFHLLGDRKVYQHTLEIFLNTDFFQQIILVCHPEWIDDVKKECYEDRIKIVPGAESRQGSVYKGLLACDPTDFVMIHDGVRPLVSQEILLRNKEAVLKYKAVNTCIPSTDTIVHAEQDSFVTSIPSRKKYWRGQTPQSFDFRLILEAHQKTKQTNATDDCSLCIEQGHLIAIIHGDEKNLKITSELDKEMAETLLKLTAKL